MNEKPDAELIKKDVELLGPGDVIGIDQSIIVRTDPKNKIGDFEPNFFPMIEFWEEDFPWMITPARKVDTQWQPWVCLIGLRNPKNLKNEDDAEGEFFEPLHYDGSKPTPYITVKNPKNSLPDLTYSWAWAHAQVTTEDMEDIEEMDASRTKQIIDTNPERIVSRLVCPRRLEPGVLYTAFLVPTFETGRRAGLGISIDEDDVNLLDMAWKSTSDDHIEIPYYYRWEFRTGLRGDFEYLVRLLEPRPLDSRVGKRPIDCSNPGFGIPLPESVKPLELGLEGALKHVDSTTESCPEVLKQKLEEKLNIPETLSLDNFSVEDRPYIVPPIYGRWHAGIKMIKETSLSWIKQLNLDPRNRATANFGTEVVQSQQESLMHEAWRQIGAVEEA
ncbi:hypothetical protein KA005_23065, partial [bacterium]|nr:hypothetical protein [bacterium]